MERAQINVRIHPTELKKLRRAAKSEGYDKFSHWVKAHLWDAAGIDKEPIDLRPKANRDRHK